MILAGPGSGKTTVITRRVEHMIRGQDIDPSSILVVTFSRAAANEMRERFLILTGRRRFPVTFGTFHAIFFQILKYAYGYTSRQIASGEMQRRFVCEYIRRLRLECEDEAELARNILTEISLCKNRQIPPEDFRSASCDRETFSVIWEAYGEFLRQNRCLDFDDMLVLTKELLEQREDILEGWQNRFHYILVDEFQDINRIQYDIVRMLARPRNNLFVVGDDDQSIYRFRGSDPSIMLRFDRDYPETKKILLGANYRSTPEIVRAAGNLIAHNETRFPKEIRAIPASGREPVGKIFETQREQNEFVIETILRLNREGGIPFGEMAVLFRTNAQPFLLMHMMAQRNVPYVSKGSIPSLYEHWIARDLNAYLRLAAGDRTRASFLRIMNRPNRWLSRESLPFEPVSFRAWEDYYRVRCRTSGSVSADRDDRIGALRKLEADLGILAGLRPYAAINYIRRAAGYERYLENFAQKYHTPAEQLMSVLDAIQEDARDYGSCEEWFAHQEEFKIEWKKKFSGKNDPDSAVRLETLHAAKGLEFDTVFLVDVNERIIPDKKAVTAEDIAEERRLFYVGMTRAKRRLYLLCSKQIRNKTMEPSRFLAECGIGKK